ncbi:MAG: response regulator transcription factor [Pirellulaceae bacterium]
MFPMNANVLCDNVLCDIGILDDGYRAENDEAAIGHDAVFVVDHDVNERDWAVSVSRSLGIKAEGYSSTSEFIQNFAPSQSGCLVVGLPLLGVRPVEQEWLLHSLRTKLPLVAVAMRGSVADAVQAKQGGAFVLLTRPLRRATLVKAIRSALEVSSRRRATENRLREMARRLDSLNSRETQVMELILDGKLNKVIACDLAISHRTVDRLRAALFDKLGVESAGEVARAVTEFRVLRTEGHEGHGLA